MTDDADVIQHLIQVEHEAAQMLSEAQKEADEKISSARAQSESMFREKYSQEVAQLESQEEAQKVELAQIHQKALEEYRSQLESNQKDVESFNSFLKTIL